MVNCCFGFFLQFDNLNATHETSKLKIEASHSEKIELLKKAYETSLSGKNTFSLLKSNKSSWNSLVCFRTEMIHNFPSRECTVVFSFGGFLGFLLHCLLGVVHALSPKEADKSFLFLFSFFINAGLLGKRVNF